MKKVILISLYLLFVFSIKANDTIENLVVWSKDGTKVEYALVEQPKITFTEANLVITSKGVEVNYELENIVRFTYENSTTTVISNIETDEARVDNNGEYILFSSLKENSIMSIYTLNGTLVFSTTICDNDEYAFPLSQLSVGVYLVNVNGLTYKIAKR